MGYSKICKGYLSEFSDHISSHHLRDLHASIPLSLNLHFFSPISECERLDKLIKIFQEIQALLYNTLNGMQDIHSVGGGRLFGGGGGGDRRLRQHPHHPHHQALKCPRCDSLNTKFCYYNNYNLSQPRHFCKNCRRYWTKGGVLRNVPVGGGCRKTKRNSKPKSDSEPSAQTQTQSETQREHKTKSHSSSESSSTLTVTNNNNNNNTNVEAVTSVHSSSSVLSSMTDNNTQFFGHARSNNGNNNNNNDPGFDQSATTALLEQGSSDCGIFSEIGSFTNLITSSNEALPFGFGNFLNDNAQQNLEHVQNEQWQQQQEQRKLVSGSIIGGHQELKMQDLTSGLLDQTAQVELSGNNGGFGLLDWQGSCGDHGLFDLPNAVDYASYWSQSTQWTDQDHPSLYLP